MATITKTKTWITGDSPTAANINSNFDTLYAALTAGTSQVSHLDGSVAFTSRAVLPTNYGGLYGGVEYGLSGAYDTYAERELATPAGWVWQAQLKALTGPACFLHSGSHGFPAISAITFQTFNVVGVSAGSDRYTYAIPVTFSTDILTIIATQYDVTTITAGTRSEPYVDRANCTTSSISMVVDGASTLPRFSFLVVGW